MNTFKRSILTRLSFLVVIAFILFPLLCGVPSYGADSPKPFLGINHQPTKVVLDSLLAFPATTGIQITTVQAETPAERGGLRAGDIIIAMDQIPFTVVPDSATPLFIRQLYTHVPGDTLRLEVLRLVVDTTLFVNYQPETAGQYLSDPGAFIDSLPIGKPMVFNLMKKWVRKDLSIVLGRRNEATRPALPEINTTALGKELGLYKPKGLFNWEAQVDSGVARYDMVAEYQDLRKRLRGIEEWDDGTRLPIVAAIHRDPFVMEKYGRMVTGNIAKNRDSNLKVLFMTQEISRAVTGNDLVATPYKIGVLALAADTAAFRLWFEKALAPVKAVLDSAYGAFTPDEKKFFIANRFSLTDVFAETIYIDGDQDVKRRTINRDLLILGSKINLAKLHQAGWMYSQFVEQVEPMVFNWMERHTDVRLIHTCYGTVCLGGKGADRWERSEYKFIFDPGGNDFYADGTATAASFDSSFALIIDVTGDDAYQSTQQGAQACGAPGIAVSIDYAGNDSYIGSRWAQGTGYCGIGVLIDKAGDDWYYGSEFAQGAGLFGVGVLAYVKGNDHYTGFIHCQGVGFTLGL